MKRLILFLSGSLLYIGLSFLFSSYDPHKAHPGLNEAIVNQFQEKILGSNALEKFKYFSFDAVKSDRLTGLAVTNEGYLIASMSEGNETKTPLEWIQHGGTSADQPELPAAVRHFYDPTEPPGERHLKDHLSSLEPLPFNPDIDHIEWATTHVEHRYNWEQAKYHVYLALIEPQNRNKHMAFAYRALGETLHMVADMGCPAHVRDDSHPGFWYEAWLSFGTADIYEEIYSTITDGIEGWSNGVVDPALSQQFSVAESVVDIATSMAQYTNSKFFTNQTISGDNVVPKIHPEKTYPNPKLEDSEYQTGSYTYSQNVSGHIVKHCKDRSYFWSRGYPYMDRECVTSQAAALTPQIVAAGAQVMRLFFPHLEVKINEFTGGSIKGEVIHHTDEEYQTAIRYNGPVDILNALSGKKLATVNCVEGEFDEVVNLSGSGDNAEILAEVEFGGARIRSKVFAPSQYFTILVSMRYFWKGKLVDGQEVTNWENTLGTSTPFPSMEGVEGNPVNLTIDGATYTETWDYTAQYQNSYSHHEGALVITFQSENRDKIIAFDYWQKTTTKYDYQQNPSVYENAISSTSCDVPRDHPLRNTYFLLEDPSVCGMITSYSGKATEHNGNVLVLDRAECADYAAIEVEMMK